MDKECDLSKSLGNQLEEYMSSDLSRMCSDLTRHGIIYEGDYEKLPSMLCKHNAVQITELLSRKTGRPIWYAYDDKVGMIYIFYNEDDYTRDEAISCCWEKEKNQK